MKGLLIQLSLDFTMQVLGIDAWDLVDGVTIDGLVEAILWLLFIWDTIRGTSSISSSQVIEYYLEIK